MHGSRTQTVLGKRRSRAGSLVLHLSGTSESEYEAPVAGPSTPTLSSKLDWLRPFPCTHYGCSKSYTKPSRLAEHERSHTGVRPFVCATCGKSYLRETHLQAHTRAHLPESDRPIVCEEEGCGKRFWTAQHLKYHENVLHKGEKPFKCTAEECGAAFLKHHQLRAHLATEHAPPGTKPYQCEHAGCTKSFPTAQKLTAHGKVHNEKRYTCVHAACVSTETFFATWTALQHHNRTAHPPTCPHESCNGRVFATRGGLRGHLKVHEQREMEASDSDEDGGERPRKRRRGGEIGRDWRCREPGCTKDFKSKKALTTHHTITHLGERNFVCTHEECGQTFGYKHILQRHVARVHGHDLVDTARTEAEEEDDDPDAEPTDYETDAPVRKTPVDASAIDAITGKAYAERTPRKLACPYPHFTGIQVELPQVVVGAEPCEYSFGRAYDLRRHLRAVHEVVLEKGALDRWARGIRV
ncbi:hypothetical protein FA95DRAFT_1563607 [Auriscalpium vulgare]|uniref:Uncharacterized protein n=1 Tax=Auriscalpium vulgare TaxID=40419 RepID=A0ACB8RG72_9AGAM|nr:hypothetical protein FA95DRAFT_1563607 [Auriscalpium vulgare]